MKQYLTLKSTSELTPQFISEVLGKRFPTYAVSIKNDSVRVKKNALVTVAVKTNQEADQSVISVSTLMPWWVWAFIGWVLYLIVKRGFVDEVFSTLLHDFRLMYPNSISERYSPSNMIDWKKKTKSLATISTILLVWIMCFSYLMSFFWPFINSILFKGNLEEHTTFIRLYSFTYLIPSFLWLLIGTKLARLGSKTIKCAGILIMTFAIYSLCLNILSILRQYEISIINIPYSYIHIFSIIDFVLLFSAGCFINKNTRNGATRYLSFALLLLSVVNFLAYIVNHVIFDFENITVDKISLITTITSCCVSPFCYIAYVLIYRAFHKLPIYPI